MKKILLKYFSIVLLFTSGFQLRAQRIDHFTIKQGINGGQDAAVFQDEPVLFDLAIYNKKAQADKRWNMAGDERLKELDDLLKQGKIKKEEYDKEKASIEKNRRTPSGIEIDLTEKNGKIEAIVWKAKFLGAGANAMPVHLPIKPSSPPTPPGPKGGKAMLDADAYYVLTYVIAPGDLMSLAPGAYLIECSINNVTSNEVKLIVKKGNMDAATANSDVISLRLGSYYHHLENGSRVVEYADKILAKNPASVDGLSLKGDGLVLQKSYAQALETYNKAVKEYYRQNGADSEPPEYLQSRIDWLKKQLEQ
ncbi:MAG: hypothetical protein HZB42_07315 [Sphingobacteriales bacterium]|nr:hypothetical protein [Sphingobacteriales bacterium]